MSRSSLNGKWLSEYLSFGDSGGIHFENKGSLQYIKSSSIQAFNVTYLIVTTSTTIRFDKIHN